MSRTRTPLHTALTIGFSSTALLAGCVAQVPPAIAPELPSAPTKYYVLSVEADKNALEGALDNKAESLTRDANKVINAGIKLAFQPPDRCLSTTAAPEGAAKDDYISIECGVLVSSLELAAAKAGYEVVSWQGLKDPNKRPLEKAKQLGVDVLFEVNQLSANERTSGSASYTGLSFYEQSNAVDRAPVPVTPDVAQRCKNSVDLAASAGTLKLDENSATLDAKAVHVATGRAIWYYSKTVRDDADSSDMATRDYYFAAPPSLPPAPERAPTPKYNKRQRAGGLLAGIGSVFMVPGIAATAIGVNSEGPLLPMGGALIAVGAGMLIGGAILIISGNKQAREFNSARGLNLSVEQYVPNYPPPQSVLCAQQDTTPDFMQTGGFQPSAQPQSSSSYSFTDTTTGSGDLERRRREKLFQMVAEDFVGELTKLN